ncbi:MAG: exodeoxyribonuclease small subunit [Actinotalea sp.]|nr:exodeoxyribonuclease small subunit [Actinotalea sp.]
MPPPAARATDSDPTAGASPTTGGGGRLLVPVEQLTYEQARDELVAVVGRLEAGGETLEGSLELWERGEALAARCQQWLDGARQRLDAAHRAPAAPSAPAPAGSSAAAEAPPADHPDRPHDDEDAR